MAYREPHGTRTPALNIEQNRNQYGIVNDPNSADLDAPSPSRSIIGRAWTGMPNSSSSIPMSIPGSRRGRTPPPALPPPTNFDHDTDHGWQWGNRRQEMNQDSHSRPPSPEYERRDHQRPIISDEEQPRRKSSTSTSASTSTSTWASARSPLHIETRHEASRDSLASPVGNPMLSVQRHQSSHAYDDMLKRRIGGGNTPSRPVKSTTYDIPRQGHAPVAAKPLPFRSFTSHENSSSSSRKLSSANDPLWNPSSNQSLMTSPSLSSRQSYFGASPRDDTFSIASSATSYGGSIHSKIEGYNEYPRHPARSELTRAMVTRSPESVAVSNNNKMTSASISSPPKHQQNYNTHENRNPEQYQGGGYAGRSTGYGVGQVKIDQSGGTSSIGFKRSNPRQAQSEPEHFREEYREQPVSLRPNLPTPSAFNNQREADNLVVLPTRSPDYSTQHPEYRYNMKRKDPAIEHDGPPPKQLQHEGRRSPNPIAMSHPAPSSYYHDPGAVSRLSPSVNPLDPGHDRHSPYMNQIAIDPVLDHQQSTPYPAMGLEAQQHLVAAAAQSASEQILAQDGLIQQHGGQQITCDCCPKKPKKFNTEAELRAHHQEKQYVCSFCQNRFKNKNEMERHQMSLHLRDRSWSCAALERNYEAAFHPATAIPPNNPGHAQQIQPPPPAATDVCGYCGQHFPNPPDFLARGEHLTNVHKFAECNQSKKFWRADHFRQHLKHSHGGIPGKWTNMLEQACLKIEASPMGDMQLSHDPAETARAAQEAAERAQQAIQASQAHGHHELHPLPPLTSYQVGQLQSATGNARGPYPTNNDFGPMGDEHGRGGE